MPLVITRRPHEKFSIGPDITVEVGQIKGNQVRLLITAPREMLILREELARKRALEVLKS